MTRLRERLAVDLANEVRRNGLVVWDDPERIYVTVAADVVPEGCAFARYDGSWFALRREVEPLLTGPSRPNLLLYVPATPPANDPLEEIRQAAARKPFKPSLRSLLKGAFGGELTEARIEEVARQARTFPEAEAAVDSAPGLDARLAAIFSSGDTVSIVVAVLTGEQDANIEGADAWPLVGEFLVTRLGLAEAGQTAEDVRTKLFRHAALSRLAGAVGALPDSLATAFAGSTARQSQHCRNGLDQLRHPRNVAAYERLARAFDADLGIDSSLAWSDGLADVDVTPAIESIALREGTRRLETEDYRGAYALAEHRLRSSLWVTTQAGLESGAIGPGHPFRRWPAIRNLALLRDLLSRQKPPRTGSRAVVTWYADQGWRVDRAHRMAELSRAQLGHSGELDAHFAAARHAYEHWLDESVASLTTAVSAEGFEPGGLLQQTSVYPTFLKPLLEQGGERIAYVLVDALRLELAHALADRFGMAPERLQRSVVLASLPTITPVGMASLFPRSDEGLSVSIDAGGKLTVATSGMPLRTAADRVDVLRREAGEVADLTFTELINATDAKLKETLASSRILLVRSGDIDKAGEAGNLGTAWRAVEGILDDLVTQLLRLGQLGVRRAVVTADHGFVVLSQALSSAWVLERPTGTGELHRRCWVGTGGLTPPGAVRIPLSELGVAGGLDLVVPAGLSVFPAGGGRQFFHGGLAPQEVVVPVLEVDLTSPEPAGAAGVDIVVAGRGITTGVFAATLDLKANLFAQEVTVRVTARTRRGSVAVARPVAGDGFDPETGIVTVSTDRRSVLTFQVVVNLEAGHHVDLEVLDAATGVRLAAIAVPVVTAVTVEEDW